MSTWPRISVWLKDGQLDHSYSDYIYLYLYLYLYYLFLGVQGMKVISFENQSGDNYYVIEHHVETLLLLQI